MLPSRLSWAVSSDIRNHHTANSSDTLYLPVLVRDGVSCVRNCHSFDAVVLPCPRRGSCGIGEALEDVQGCNDGHSGVACGSCVLGWSAPSACDACKECPSSVLPHFVASAVPAALQLVAALASAGFAVHGYVKAPERVATNLFSGGLRLGLWYIGMAAQIGHLHGQSGASLQASSQSLGQWVNTCGMARPWASGVEVGANASLYENVPFNEGSSSILDILSAASGGTVAAFEGSIGCAFGGGDPSSPSSPGAVLLLGSSLCLLAMGMMTVCVQSRCASSAWPGLLLLPPVLYVNAAPGFLRGLSKVCGLQPQWGGLDTPDGAPGFADGIVPFASALSLHVVVLTAGTVTYLSWRQWCGHARAARPGATLRGLLAKGYRTQFTVQQARELATSVLKKPALVRAAVAEAETAQASCCGAAWLLPTQAFVGVQMAVVVIATGASWFTVDVVTRLVSVGAGLSFSMALVFVRRPWVLGEITDLDVLAHAGLLIHVMCAGLNALTPATASWTTIITSATHVLVLVGIFLAVLRGYSQAARAALAKVGRRIRSWFPELGPAEQPTLTAGELGDVASSNVPGLHQIVWALLMRGLRCGVKPARTQHTVDLGGIMSMLGEQDQVGAEATKQILGTAGHSLVRVPASSAGLASLSAPQAQAVSKALRPSSAASVTRNPMFVKKAKQRKQLPRPLASCSHVPGRESLGLIHRDSLSSLAELTAASSTRQVVLPKRGSLQHLQLQLDTSSEIAGGFRPRRVSGAQGTEGRRSSSVRRLSTRPRK